MHLRLFPDVPVAWRDDALADSFSETRKVRNVITSALEIMRRDRKIGSGLDAEVSVHAGPNALAELTRRDLAELAIASRVTVTSEPAPDDAHRDPAVPDVAVCTQAAEGHKCARCWRVLPEVAESPAQLCQRCRDAI